MITTSNTFVNLLMSKRKYYFWYGSGLFWFMIIIESLLVNPEALASLKSFILAVEYSFKGFLLTIILRFFYKKFNVHRFRLFPLITIILIYSMIITLIWTYSVIIIGHIYKDWPFPIPFDYMRNIIEINYFTIFLWSGLYLGYKFWEEWENQRYQFERERAMLKSAQLEMLKYQLNPHFLFNTLSSLRGLITVEPGKAKEMVTQISEFLRYSLLEGKNNEVQLIKEIEIIKQYLSIEQIRFNEDLIVEFDISTETNDFMIPIFLIHPLVENAVKHGMQTSQLPLRINIKSEFKENILLLQVTNSGYWLDGNSKTTCKSTGIGLQNVQKRLEHSFPGNHSFEINKTKEFVKVKIKINY